uniref:RRM domain-containing protein n=1 Tax=Mesocestoides corti TaxID=53468 RepID=A0A5K3EXR8_MESCO
MSETKYLWITNIPSKCKEEDVSRVLRRHGDIKTSRTVHHNSCFNLIVEFIDRSSAARAVRSQNILKGNILKVDYCDSLGNPWISSLSHRSFPLEPIQNHKSDRPDTMLVDRPGPSSTTSNHHHHHHNHHHQQQQQQHSPRAISSPTGQLRCNAPAASSPLTSPPSKPPSTTSSSVRRQTGVQGSALKLIFTPPAKYSEAQIKRTLCHELHKFGKTFCVNLLPSTAGANRQTRTALVVFRRPDDEEKAFLAYRNGPKSLFGASVDVELCSSADPDAIGLSLPNARIRSALPLSTSSPVSLHSSLPPSDSSVHRSQGLSPAACGGSVLPSRTLIVHGLTVGPSGPVSDYQLTTAFRRFGEILHAQMKPSSNSATIEFVEFRGASRAMTTHLRDPLRLGGRPLKLFYTPSRPSTCLWLADLPPALASLPEAELLATFSRIAPVEQMSLINRSTDASPLSTVHTSAFLRLQTPEAAAQLLAYLRSSESPLLSASNATNHNRLPESTAGSAPSKPPVSLCSADFASPKYVEKFANSTARCSEYLNSAQARSRPLVPASQPPPPTFEMVNGKPRVDSPRLGCVDHDRNHGRHNSSGEDNSCTGSSVSTSSSSFSPSKRLNLPAENSGSGFSRLHKNSLHATGGEGHTPATPAATFPSQRRIVEASLFLPQKRINDSQKRDPGLFSTSTVHRGNYSSHTQQKLRDDQELLSRLSPNDPVICESMYDKIKRRTEGEKERRKRPPIEDSLNGEISLKRKKKRKREYNEDGVLDEDETLVLDRHRKINSEKHRRKHSDPLADSRHHRRNRHGGSSSSSSKVTIENQRPKHQASLAPSKSISNTITRLSLGMSVPVAASYHTISKTSSHVQRPNSRLLSSSSNSVSAATSSEEDDTLKRSFERRSPTRLTAMSSPRQGVKKAFGNPAVNRSLSLNDVDSESSSSVYSSAASKRRKNSREGVKASTTTTRKTAWSGKQQCTSESPLGLGVPFRAGRAWSSSLSSDEENDRWNESRYSKWSSNGSGAKANPVVSSDKRRKQRVAKPKHTGRKIRSLSDSSSSSSSGGECDFDRASASSSVSGSVLGANAVGSGGSRPVKSVSPWRGSEAQAPFSDPDDGDSLDDFERFSANSPSTPSTEAMESCPEADDDEGDRLVSDWPSCMSSNNSPFLSEPESDPGHSSLHHGSDGRPERKSLDENFSRNFEDVTMLNCSKDESLNLSGGDAIGEIRMDDQPSPKLNESSDKSTSKSTVIEEEGVYTKSEPLKLETSPIISAKAASTTPLKIEPGSLPPPPVPLMSPSVHQVLSPYSSSSPTQSLCSACSRTSPSPVTTSALILTSSWACSNTSPETTACVKTTASLPQDTAPKIKPSPITDKPAALSENRDLERYVQSVIERVKAETVDDSQQQQPQQQHRPVQSAVGHVTATTPITSPSHPPNGSPPTPTSKKGASPATSIISSRRASGGTSPGTTTTPSPNTRSAMGRVPARPPFDLPTSFPSIPGVNACAPISETSLTQPNKVVVHKVEEPPTEAKVLRSSSRRRGKAVAVAPTAVEEVAVDKEVEKPLDSSEQPMDPYEPNFDDDSPPVSKPTANATSPLIINTNLPTSASEQIGPASSISSVTTEEVASTLPQQSAGERSKTSTRRTALDTVDEVISEVCSGHFDMQGYLDSWRRPLSAVASTTAPAPVTTVTGPAVSTPVAAVASTTTTPPSAKAPDASNSKSPAANNALFTAIINALQSIPGSQVVIGGNNNSGGTVLQPSVPVAASVAPNSSQQLTQKPSTVVVGSSPPTISATTITFPVNAVFLKNVFSASGNSAKNASATPSSIKTSMANSLPATMTTASPLTQQQLHQQHVSSVVMSRPQSSTSESAKDTPHPCRMRRGSDNGPGASTQPAYVDRGRSRSNSGLLDDVAVSTTSGTPIPQQRSIFNPRCFTSPPRFPPLSPPRHVPPPPPPPHPPTPWSLGPFHSYQRPTRQEAPMSPFTPILEKLSRLIEPELVLPLIQAVAMQLGQDGLSQLSEADLIASMMKLFHHITTSGAGGGGGGEAFTGVSLPPATTNSALSANSTPSPSHAAVSVAFGSNSDHPSPGMFTSPTVNRGDQPSGGQYLHSRAPSSSSPSTTRTGSFDQAYPLVWQGRLSLKNAEVSVALHFVRGNAELLRSCITLLAVGGGGTPQQALVTSGGPLRIVQRMRLEASQLDAVQRKMTQEGASCACVAFASGSNRADLAQQNVALSEGFIRYMLEKGAAGIINVGHPEVSQGLYVVHIFPPCEFSHAQLRLAAPDLHQGILQTQLPHLLIVITTV